MNATDLSFVLEVINGGWAILSFVLMMVCAAYLFHELRIIWEAEDRHWRVASWHLDWTIGMRVAAAIGTISAGIFITRTTIYIWRAVFAGGDFSMLQLYFLVTGATIGAIGFLCAIREISTPLFGRYPWAGTMLTLFAAVAAMVYFHF